MIKKPGCWITILLIILALVSGYLYIKNVTNKIYPEEIIYNTTEQFRPNLKLFLSDVNSTIEKLRSDVSHVNVDTLPLDSLNKYFSHLTGKRELLHGVVLFGDKMNYVIFRDQDSWIFTFNNLQDSIVNWQRIDKNLHPVPNGSWTDTYNNFMDESNFGSVKISQLMEGEYIWRAAKSTLPDNQDLLFNVFRLDTGDDIDIAALVYSTSEIGNRFSRMLTFESLLVSILTEKENIVSPIRTKDTAMISRFRILETKVSNNFSLWKNTYQQQAHTFTIDEFNKQYYSRFDTIMPQLGVTGYAITIATDDLIDSKKKVDELYLYVAVLLILFALFIFLNTFNRFKKQRLITAGTLTSLAIDEIERLIAEGETELIEFKSSLRWDYREEKVNKILENVILKSIAAFANAKGGTLFIGVNDDLEIIGLEPDFNTLKKQDADYFELHLRKMINNQFGIKFSNRFLHMHLPAINDRVICVVQVLPSNRALFVKTRNKQGQQVEKFYVRSGNASQEISSLTEVNDYIKERFDSGN